MKIGFFLFETFFQPTFWHGKSREQHFVTVYEARKIYTFQNISCTRNGKGLVWTFTYNLSIGRSEYGTMKIGFFYLKRFFNLLFDTAEIEMRTFNI